MTVYITDIKSDIKYELRHRLVSAHNTKQKRLATKS